MGGGPPCFPQGSSCPVVLRIPASPPTFRIRDYYPLRCRLSFRSSARYARSTPPVLYPIRLTPHGLGSSAFARHYSRNHSCFLFLGVLRCFSSPRIPPPHYLTSCDGTRAFTPGGFPHSDIHVSTAICASTWLFAACHVLRRLLVPRHPPCALISLTLYFTIVS